MLRGPLEMSADETDERLANQFAMIVAAGALGQEVFDAVRITFLGGLGDLLADHPDTRGRDVLELPYVTRAYRFSRR